MSPDRNRRIRHIVVAIVLIALLRIYLVHH
jgi:hypothetical protein